MNSRAALKICLVALCLLSACVSPRSSSGTVCTSRGLTIDFNFEGAGRHRCLSARGARFALSVVPEQTPINPSPWYAFRITALSDASVVIALHYAGAHHRYAPKTSRDFLVWNTLQSDAVQIDEGANAAVLRLTVGAGVTYVAAQPVRTQRSAMNWANGVLAPAGFEAVEYGRSVEGRPLIAFIGGGEAGDGLVVALTHQHPPEVNGAAAFSAFAETIASDQSGARQFRQQNRILLALMPNPDGVARGHRRLNASGVDLNRDWRRFSEVETRTLRDLIEREAAMRRTVAFIDFHSTRQSIVFSPPFDAQSATIGFLPFLRGRLAAGPAPQWQFGHDPRTGSSKAWALERLGAPGITLEVSDAADFHQSQTLGIATAHALVDYFRSEAVAVGQ